MPVLIGFTGRIGSGKDTSCSLLGEWAESHGLVLERHGFADKLKTSAARALGAPTDWTTKQCVDFCNELKQPGVDIHVTKTESEYMGEWPSGGNVAYQEPIAVITGREYLQFYGTEAHREVFDSEFWVDALLPRPSDSDASDERREINQWELRDRFPEADIIGITDVRFPNEAERIRDLGGFLIELTREETGEFERGKTAHASEAGVGETDYLILNDGSLDKLKRNVVEAFRRKVGI